MILRRLFSLRHTALALLCGTMLPLSSPGADPDFPLSPGAPDNAKTLSELGGTRRKLVVFGPEGPVLGISGMKWNAMRNGLASVGLAAGLRERDTIVIIATQQGVALAPGLESARVPMEAIARARAACGIGPGGAALVLIGKDGGIKQTWRGAVEPEVIFAAIDAMQMRQRERAERGR